MAARAPFAGAAQGAPRKAGRAAGEACMRIHFTSARPCALKLGGAPAGYVGEAEKFIDCGKERILAEFIPADGNFLPLAFVLGEEFFAAPPACCDVYRYGFGADVHAARFAPHAAAIRPRAQLRAGDCLVTVYENGGTFAALEGGGRFALHPLPAAENYEAEEVRVAGERFFCIRARGAAGQTLHFFNENFAPALHADADGFSAGDGLETVKAHADIAGHTERRRYLAEGGKLLPAGRTAEPRAGFDAAALPEKLLPFAFFQAVAAGADPAPYLGEELRPKAGLLQSYLGDFCAVTLPKAVFYLVHGNVNAAGLCYRLSENLFDVRFFAADCAKGKVGNIRPVG